MPLLFALGQHRALVAVHSRLLPSDSLMAYLDAREVEHVHTAWRENSSDIATSGSMQGKLGCGTRTPQFRTCVERVGGAHAPVGSEDSGHSSRTP